MVTIRAILFRRSCIVVFNGVGYSEPVGSKQFPHMLGSPKTEGPSMLGSKIALYNQVIFVNLGIMLSSKSVVWRAYHRVVAYSAKMYNANMLFE